MKLLIAVLLTLASWTSLASNAPEITLNGLSKYAGQFVSVFYVSGKPASLGTAGQDLEVNKILAGPFTQKIGSNSLSYTSVSVPRDGFATFNFVIAVVHDQPEHFLTNLRLNNGSVTRVPVASRTGQAQDTNSNRRFSAKRFKSSIKLKNNPSLNF